MHKYLLKRDIEDERDLKVSFEKATSLPSKVDLRPLCPPIFDQGDLGSCTANAGVAAYMMLKKNSTLMSRLYLYYQERYLEGNVNHDSGAQMRNIGKSLQKFGVCEEPFFPYDVRKFTYQPSAQAIQNASQNRVLQYKKLSNVCDIKQYISQKKLSVMIGIDVYESFESDSTSKTGIIPMPNTQKERMLGGHAVAVVGYDDNFGKTHKSGNAIAQIADAVMDKLTGTNDDGYLIVRNSWGSNWGDKGYFYLPYSFLSKYAYDFWVLQ